MSSVFSLDDFENDDAGTEKFTTGGYGGEK